MIASTALLSQRSRGSVRIRMEQSGPIVLREEGAAKCRLPRGSHEAILINTSGGLAGGDSVEIIAEAGPGARLTLTSQAAERVYRTVGPPAHMEISLSAGPGSNLRWLPQETILFEGSALNRTIEVDLAGDATFCAVECLVFGRRAMGEILSRVNVEDRWSVRRDGNLIHMESVAFGPDMPASPATLAGAHLAATILLVAPEAERMLGPVREALDGGGAVSAWNGKLIARLLGSDSLSLRKALVRVLFACVGSAGLPKVWTM